MPICNSCAVPFPINIKIENKHYKLTNRKNCLKCVPFKQRKQQTKFLLPTIDLICTQCTRIYAYHHAHPQGHTKTKCNSCLVNDRRFGLKKKCVEYKGGKCEHCGYKKSLRALNFHHKDPTQKDFGISGKHCYSWERIKAELDKCILLCSNCHMEVHEELDNVSNNISRI